MRPSLASALLLVSAFTLPSLSLPEPLDEPAPVLACPECALITDAIEAPHGIMAVGERGLIAEGELPGGWKQIPVPVRRMLTAVTHTAEGHLVAVGHDALVLTNAGPELLWTVIHASPELDMPLLDIWIAGDGKGLAVGAYGLALITDDHGRSWSRQHIDPEESHFYAIREAPDKTLFIAGEFGTVLRSRDRGVSWVRLDTGWDGTFFGVQADRAGRLLLYGLEGAILESRDGGEAWHRLESGVSTSLYDAAFLSDDRAVIVGADGMVLVESAPGRFERISRARREAITAVLVTAPDSVLLFGEGGTDRLTLSSGGHALNNGER